MLQNILNQKEIMLKWGCPISIICPSICHISEDEQFQIATTFKKEQFKITNDLAIRGSIREIIKFFKFRNVQPENTNTNSITESSEKESEDVYEYIDVDINALSQESNYKRIKDYNILELPSEMFGILNMLCPTTKFIRKRQLEMIRSCFNFVYKQLEENDGNTERWCKVFITIKSITNAFKFKN